MTDLGGGKNTIERRVPSVVPARKARNCYYWITQSRFDEWNYFKTTGVSASNEYNCLAYVMLHWTIETILICANHLVRWFISSWTLTNRNVAFIMPLRGRFNLNTIRIDQWSIIEELFNKSLDLWPCSYISALPGWVWTLSPTVKFPTPWEFEKTGKII